VAAATVVAAAAVVAPVDLPPAVAVGLQAARAAHGRRVLRMAAAALPQPDDSEDWRRRGKLSCDDSAKRACAAVARRIVFVSERNCCAYPVPALSVKDGERRIGGHRPAGIRLMEVTL
jgi:hypothetical protein